jgi:hypothetical protein
LDKPISDGGHLERSALKRPKLVYETKLLGNINSLHN